MSEYYVAGGTLHPESPCYVERDADRDLFENLLKGEFCYVLTSRQMGKSSLMARTAWKLRKRGFEVVMIDLTAVGQNVNCDQWYDGLVMQLAEQLDMEDEVEKFWKHQERLSPIQRFVRTLTRVILESISHNLIIFIDEIDVVQSLSFSADELFGAIRECYNRRNRDTIFQRLDFCLLGVASPVELVRDASISPFNSGVEITLRDFTLQETEDLAQGLNDEHGLLWNVSHQVFHWTQGHPYLTLRLFSAVANLPTINGAEDVDEQCQTVFLQSKSVNTDPNLIFINQWLLRSEVVEVRRDLLEHVRLLTQNKQVSFEENNPLHQQLMFSGICVVKNGHLVCRNPVYRQVFGDSWIKLHFPKVPAPQSPERALVKPLKTGAYSNMVRWGWGLLLVLVLGLICYRVYLEGNETIDKSEREVEEPILISSDDAKIMELARSVWKLNGNVFSTEGFFDPSYKGIVIPGEFYGVRFDNRPTLPLPEQLQQLSNLDLIHYAAFENAPFSIEHLQAITTWTNLMGIGIDHTLIDFEGLKLLQNFPKLRSTGIDRTTPEIMDRISKVVPLLGDLSLYETTITSDLFRSSENFAFLSHINFFGFQFSGCGMETLKDLPALNSIRFAQSYGQYMPLQSVVQLKRLEHLDLQDMPLSQQDLQAVSQVESLRQLDLGPQVTVNPTHLLILEASSISKLNLRGLVVPETILNRLRDRIEVNVFP